MPCPKICCQNLLTATRAVKGCSGCVSHWANSYRVFGCSSGLKSNADGTVGKSCCDLSGRLYCPRLSRYVSRGFSRSCMTIRVLADPGCGRLSPLPASLRALVSFRGSGVAGLSISTGTSGHVSGISINGGLLPLLGPTPHSALLLK